MRLWRKKLWSNVESNRKFFHSLFFIPFCFERRKKEINFFLISYTNTLDRSLSFVRRSDMLVVLLNCRLNSLLNYKTDIQNVTTPLIRLIWWFTIKHKHIKHRDSSLHRGWQFYLCYINTFKKRKKMKTKKKRKTSNLFSINYSL